MATQSNIEIVVDAVSDLPRVRAAIRGLAADVGVAIDDAVLAASELATNALTHADGRCVVRAWRSAGNLRVEVTDAVEAPLPPTKPVAIGSPSGRGLFIVEQVTERWGVTLQPGGKTVWFEM